MSRLFITLIAGLFLTSPVLSKTLFPGAELPDLSIKDKGLLQLQKDDVNYRSWSSTELSGQRYVIQYISARLKPGKMNVKLNDRLYDIDHPQSCRTVSIINVNDAVWGTKLFVQPELTSNQKRTPLCKIVYDAKGEGINVWGLKTKNNATIVIDEKGVIRFFHEGELSERQIQTIIDLSRPITPQPQPASLQAGNADSL